MSNFQLFFTLSSYRTLNATSFPKRAQLSIASLFGFHFSLIPSFNTWNPPSLSRSDIIFIASPLHP
jgi:hypothetical protein